MQKKSIPADAMDEYRDVLDGSKIGRRQTCRGHIKTVDSVIFLNR
jgi:hypothetical protein